MKRKLHSPIEDEKVVPKKDEGKDAESEDKEEKGPFREAIEYDPVQKPEIKNNQKTRVRAPNPDLSHRMLCACEQSDNAH